MCLFFMVNYGGLPVRVGLFSEEKWKNAKDNKIIIKIFVC